MLYACVCVDEKRERVNSVKGKRESFLVLGEGNCFYSFTQLTAAQMVLISTQGRELLSQCKM